LELIKLDIYTIGWKQFALDLQVLGVRRWRELVTDGKKWRDIVRQSKSPKWAVVPMEEQEVSYR